MGGHSISPASKRPMKWYVLEKHWRGEPVRVLERTGLWNGAMAEWNTVFLEAPRETFRAVKKVLDLLEKVARP
ncbi:MAG: DUF4301 family protein [Bryobacterales bacterium]